MSKSGIQIPQHANRKSSQCLTDLRIPREPPSSEEVHKISGEGDEKHDGGLLPFRLVDDAEAHGEEGDEYESY